MTTDQTPPWDVPLDEYEQVELQLLLNQTFTGDSLLTPRTPREMLDAMRLRVEWIVEQERKAAREQVD